MTPDLQQFEEAWLATAEASLTLGEPRKLGISFFFEESAEFENFLGRIPDAARVKEWDDRLRGRLDLCGRRWVKLHYLDGRCRRLSHYFQIDPRISYPIASLRLFIRLLGRIPASGLERALEPALERDDTAWGLVIKQSGDESVPRISFRVPRSAAADVLHRLAQTGDVNGKAASLHAAALQTVAGTDRVFVTFGPGAPRGCSLDFEQVPRDQLPGAAGVRVRLDVFPYVKHRLVGNEPQWTVYLPYRELGGPIDCDPGARTAQGSRT